MDNKNFVIGVDFGTDSIRAIIVDATNGAEIASDVYYYPRWKAGQYCDPPNNQFRQHPAEYIEGLEVCITGALAKAPAGTAQMIRGLSVDTTGSTPCAVDRNGTPLALTPGFEENPNAMFILWKDHTAVKEAEEINALAKSWGGEDYTKYEGGVYSSEWFWSKILHVLRQDEKVRQAAFSWVEHCDWIPALLTGNTDPLTLKRSRTAAGHKAMWHASWNGLPSEEFLMKLDPLLTGLRDRLYSETYTGDVPIGHLTEEWAKRLGLTTDVIVGAGSFDAHFGAIGAEIAPQTLVKVMGTSTCDMIVSEIPKTGEHLVRGICGQVDGSIIPGMLGLEAGQSAFGDIYAWFRELLLWLVEHLLKQVSHVDEPTKNKMIEDISETIIPELSKEAEKLPIDENGIVALDWMNGRRTPDANQALKGAITGLNLGSDAPRIFRALVEATAFGAKKIVDRFVEEGVEIKSVIAIGGIPKKSPFVMQVTADVLNMPIKVAVAEQACALGSAMAAAVAAGIYPTIQEAQKKMGSGFEKVYEPNPANAAKYQRIYEKYSKLCDFVENEFTFIKTE
ncbi:MAG: ribulokinase [candidate division KSB1 bacterium]|nr:ribulokinase [candidate division KSB1 bacterium]MDZ7302387.1 ribulokinase [candidate division KSB1 bacterium]MDZ7311590.1 ribulokinase [candidate division KSB1 bacterium]